MPTSYAILGSGALGAFYGALLHHAGREVHFLLHSDYHHVRAHGLRVETTLGDRSIAKPHVYERASDMPRCDVVLIALKSTQNHLLPELLPHVMRTSGGVALLMQNGLGLEDDVAKIVGPDRVIGGLAFLCSNKVGPGHIVQLQYGHVKLGEWAADHQPRGVTDRLTALAADFRAAGVTVDIEPDLLLARWKKLVWNVPYNGMCVVMNTTTDRLMNTPSTRRLCEELMWEVVAAAASTGRTIEPAFVQHMLEHTDNMVPYLPSMRLDFDAGRPMELQAIYGNPIRTAAASGVKLPRMQMLYDQLTFLDRRPR
jgi:2-dehydropantoate 2-reductase